MIETTRAIVLNRINYNESSFIFNLFTEKYGKIAIITKRKRDRINTAYLQSFSLIEIQLTYQEKKKIQFIQDARPLEFFKTLHRDSFKNVQLIMLAETFNKMIKEKQIEPQLFEYLYNQISFFELVGKNNLFFSQFLLCKLTRFFGFYPVINYTDDDCYFDLNRAKFVNSSLFHPHCLNKEISYHIFKLFESNISKFDLEDFEPKMIKPGLRAILNYYHIHNDGFNKLNSLKVLFEIID
ncbi:MAG: DNA repair protein RecO [Marinifilaceae bacterium]|jgi:DNA repair protein RecO (recombination protein O)|nr:DNA repair protein RecO [Marinifilaceae bacterium]